MLVRDRIYRFLRSIPPGRVVTYGQIAAYLGNPRMARAVGNILHANPDGDKNPCYKVVDRGGRLSPRYAFGGLDAQRKRLEREGITVTDGRVELSVFGWTPPEPDFSDEGGMTMPVKHYNKLVRDRIPAIIEANGGSCRTAVLTNEEYLSMLDKKLDEELSEYHADPSLEELADLWEVIRATAVARGYSLEELEAARARKAAERGGFEGRILLIETES